MSSLHIAVGYSEPGNHAAPRLVYLGRSGAEMQRALERAPDARFELFHRVHGLRKNNPRAAANAAATAPAGPAESSLAAEAARLLAENVALRQRLAAAPAGPATKRARG